MSSFALLSLAPSSSPAIVAYCAVCRGACGIKLLLPSPSHHIQIKLFVYILSFAMPAMETKKHTRLVGKLIESAIATLEKGKYFNSIQ